MAGGARAPMRCSESRASTSLPFRLPLQAWFWASRPVMTLPVGPDCGVVAVGHGRRQVRLHDIPCFGRPVRLLWAKRVWRCADPDCPRTTFTEAHPLAGPRTKLTARAAAWATDALQGFDTSVSALAHQLGVSWHTAWDAIQVEAARRITRAGRLTGVNALGVDEHVWSHTAPSGTGMVTGIVDHTRDAHGVVHARLLDLVPGRSGKAYADWLKDRGPSSLPGSKRRRWTRSVATRTRSATNCPRPSPFWTPSMS